MIFKTIARLVMGGVLVIASAAYAAPDVEIGTVTGAPGDQVTVPVTYTSDGTVAALQLDIVYDPNVLQIVSSDQGTIDVTFFNDNIATAPAGSVTLLGATLPPSPIPDGAASLTFDILPGATLGVSDIEVTATLSDANGIGVDVDTETNGSVTVEGPEVSITATDAEASEANLDTGTLTVTRTGSTTSALTVNLAVAGTATSATDYAAIASTVTIPSGSDSATITVTPVDDALDEGDETVVVTIASGTTYTVGAANSGTVTIEDDDAVEVSISATDASAAEEGLDTGLFTVTRTGATTSDLTVNLTVAGDATSGNDYVAIGATVTIPAGSDSATITVTPVDDTLVEEDETVVVTVETGTSYIVATADSATVVIADNDVLPEVSIESAGALNEGTQGTSTFTISRTGNTADPLTVNLEIGGTATRGEDYVLSTEDPQLPPGSALKAEVTGDSVVIPAGEDSLDITVTLIDDGTSEGTETIIIGIADGGTEYSVAAGGDDISEITIVDDETPVVEATPIPTLSQWALILLALTLLAVSVRFSRASL